MKEFRWHRGFFHEWERRITRGVRIIAAVWTNAHDGKTFVAGIQKDSGDPGPWVYEIEFGHKTVRAAKKWGDEQIPSVRRKVTAWRKAQKARSVQK